MMNNNESEINMSSTCIELVKSFQPNPNEKAIKFNAVNGLSHGDDGGSPGRDSHREYSN